MNPIIFLDIDGVLNCQTFFKQTRNSKKELRKEVKSDKIDKLDYYKNMICPERMEWLNILCTELNADVVISSSWRLGKTLDELTDILRYAGAKFKIVSKTESLGYERGIEISKWLKDNVQEYYNFRNYVIIDDDSDMLLNQREHFFQTDNYSGLTPNTCYKIKRFLKKV